MQSVTLTHSLSVGNGGFVSSAACALAGTSWHALKSTLAATALSAGAVLCKRRTAGQRSDSSDDSGSDDQGAVASDSPVVPRRDGLHSPKPYHPAPSAALESLQSSFAAEDDHPECVVVVDPVSTGANVASAFLDEGFLVVSITSSQHSADWTIEPDDSRRRDFHASLRLDLASPEAVVDELKALGINIVAVVSGSELGVETCDLISERLGLPSNGMAHSESRRDKAAMQEQVRSSGLRAIEQVSASKWEEVEAFIDWKARPLLVLKPSRSAGSDSVIKVGSTEAARAAFDAIIGRPNALGENNHSVVVQEFLAGTEYIVDSVSRDGVHKVVAIWQYDKRSVVRSDGCVSDFIYFGQASVSGACEPGASLAAYAVAVLDALGVKHGAGHAEIIMTSTGPCLVEVGCRPQGNDGTFMPLADLVWGYNQVSALVDATVSSERFALLPSVCGDGALQAFKVDFVSSVAGQIKALRHLQRMVALESFVRFDLLPRAGDRIAVTVDCFTACGSVSLAHKDAAVLAADVATVRQLEQDMWELEEEGMAAEEHEQHKEE